MQIVDTWKLSVRPVSGSLLYRIIWIFFLSEQTDLTVLFTTDSVTDSKTSGWKYIVAAQLRSPECIEPLPHSPEHSQECWDVVINHAPLTPGHWPSDIGSENKLWESFCFVGCLLSLRQTSSFGNNLRVCLKSI